MSDTPVPSPSAPAGEDKTIAMLAYLGLLLCGVGIVIPILMHNKNKSALGAFHLRQSLGLLIVSIACAVVFRVLITIAVYIPGVGGLLGMLLGLLNMGVGLGLFVLWIIGLVAALNCEQKPVPVLGPIFAQKLASVFV